MRYRLGNNNVGSLKILQLRSTVSASAERYISVVHPRHWFVCKGRVGGHYFFQATFNISAYPSVYFSTLCLHCIFQHFWFPHFRVGSYSSAIYIIPVVLLTTAWNITRYVTIMQILTLFDVGRGGGAKKAPLLVFRSPPNENKWEACICWSMVSRPQLLECCDSFFLLKFLHQGMCWFRAHPSPLTPC